ncbi:MAG TPA: VRR-NUC domain-containing protein [Candidatus Limnocylindrales bacterium]|nr:VRR-NUC domain-containing protein [Candidatus Limnocylindrales bacterium]
MRTATPRVSETAFLAQVLDLAAMLGWEGVHFRGAWTARGYRTPVQGSLGRGWPDLVLVRARDRRLIFAELKADDGQVRPEQERVLEVLRSVTFDTGCGEVPVAHDDDQRAGCCPPLVEVAVWRPRDLEAIAELLR